MASAMTSALPPVFVALDMDAAQVDPFVEQMQGLDVGLKVGMELYYQTGPDLVRRLAKSHPIFLDLKLHDIPNTVSSAAKRIADLGVRLTTVHASGGPAMLEPLATLETETFKFLAVTVLTSMDGAQMQALGVQDQNPADRAQRLFELGTASGLSGFVCSPQEVGALHVASPTATFVTPGVRPAGSASDDQKRVATPAQAMKSGATALVVGRPITRAQNPHLAAQSILDEIKNG